MEFITIVFYPTIYMYMYFFLSTRLSEGYKTHASPCLGEGIITYHNKKYDRNHYKGIFFCISFPLYSNCYTAATTVFLRLHHGDNIPLLQILKLFNFYRFSIKFIPRIRILYIKHNYTVFLDVRDGSYLQHLNRRNEGQTAAGFIYLPLWSVYGHIRSRCRRFANQ